MLRVDPKVENERCENGKVVTQDLNERFAHVFLANVLARLTPQPKEEERRTQWYHRGVKKPTTTHYGRGVKRFLAQHGADVTGGIEGYDRLRLAGSPEDH